jgi:hypothetical protein
MANPTPRADALRAMREAKFEAAQRLIKEAGKSATLAESKPAPATKKMPVAKPLRDETAEGQAVGTQRTERQVADALLAETPVTEAKTAKTKAPKEKPAKEKQAKAKPVKEKPAKATAKKSSAKKG